MEKGLDAYSESILTFMKGERYPIKESTNESMNKDMTLSGRQCRFAVMVSDLIRKAVELDLPVKILEWTRTLEQQRIYVAVGKSKTMNSKHLDGLAVDIAVVISGQAKMDYETLKPLALYWESIGGKWGGRWGEDLTKMPPIYGWDADHFEI